MARKRLTIREKLLNRKQTNFVGRKKQLQAFNDNFAQADFANIINVFGNGGLGKTTLLRKFQDYVSAEQAIVSYTDEGVQDIPDFMAKVVEQLENQEIAAKKFLSHYRLYRQKKQELERDPQAPTGLAAFAGRTLAKGSIGLAKHLGGTPLLEYVDTDELTKQTGEWFNFIGKKLSNKEEVQLVLEPVKVLTPLWLEELNKQAAKQKICLFIDTYEAVEKILDKWLVDLFYGTYGDLDANIIFTIAGRRKLDPNKWSELLEIGISLSMEAFTLEETEQFLDKRGIQNEQVRATITRLSGGIPVLLATLAVASPKTVDHIEDVSSLAIERFLRWVETPEKRNAALLAAIPRALNLDVLRQLLPDSEVEPLFEWLQRMPFVQKRANRWTYHPVVRSQMLHYLRMRSEENWIALNNQLAEYFKQLQEALKLSSPECYKSDKWKSHALACFYHQYCAGPEVFLKDAIAGFLVSMEKNRSYAQQWTEVWQQAEEDLKIVDQAWGKPLNLAITAYNNKKYDKLEVALSRILEVSQLSVADRAIALAWRARAKEDSKKLDAAIKDYEQSIHLNPDYRWPNAYLGELYFRQGQLEKALARYSRAIEIDPEYKWAFASRAELYQKQKQFDLALKDYNRAIEIDLEYQWALVQRAELYQMQEQFDLALKDFNRAIEIAPEYRWAFIKRAEFYQLQKQFDLALRDYNRAIEIDPEYHGAIALRGVLYQAQKRFDLALIDYNRAIEIDPEYHGAIAQRGQLYQLQKQFDLALIDYNRAIEIYPKYKWAFVKRAEFYQMQKQFDLALKDYNRAIEIDPEYKWAIAKRGELYQMQKQFDLALKDYNCAIEIDPEYQWAIAKRGELYQMQKQFDLALIDYNRAIEIDPEYQWAIVQRAEFYQIQEQFDLALKDYNRAIEIDPELDWAIALRGNFHQMQKQFDLALNDYNRAIEIDPEYQWAIAKRGELYQTQKQFDLALNDYNRAIEIDPEYQWAIVKRGKLYQMQKQFNFALNDYNRAIEIDPEYKWAISNRGELYQTQKQFDLALKDYNRLIEIDPKYGWAFASRGELYQMQKQFDLALKDYNRAIEIDPEYKWAIAQRAELLLQLGQYKAAKKDILKRHVIEENDWSNYLLYLIHLKEKKQDQAENHLRTAIALAQETLEVEAANFRVLFNLFLFQFLLTKNEDQLKSKVQEALLKDGIDVEKRINALKTDLMLYHKLFPNDAAVLEVHRWIEILD